MTKIFIGNIVHCKKPFQVEYLTPGFIIVEGSKIKVVKNVQYLEEAKELMGISTADVIKLKQSQILIPGLVDTHIHAPQYPNIGLGYDKPLLEWLDTYTYNLEKKFRDLTLSKRVYNAVVQKTLKHGTTTACYFASMFLESSLELVDVCVKFGQRALVGAINMTKLAPVDYIETKEESVSKTRQFIEAVKGRQSLLVQPVITPRFALSVDMDLMRQLGEIAKEGNLHIQTHISENTAEVKLVEETFEMSYTEVYRQANLLTPKTVLAHGIYLSKEERAVLAEKGTSISHCPSSNTCLKSGMCNVRQLLGDGVNVGLGTDVSGGQSPSIVEAMRQAIAVSTHLSFHGESAPLTYEDVFSLATLGGAKALALDEKIGNFEVGKEFDALIVDADVKDGNVDYCVDYSSYCDVKELLQKFVFTGDDRNVKAVYVAGVQRV